MEVIYSRRNLPYTRSFPAEVDQGACPLGFNHNHRITRAHQVDGLEIDETFLTKKDLLGMEFDYYLCVNWGMKVGLRVGPLCLHPENTSLQRVRKQ